VKFATLALVAALMAASALAPTFAEARSVKWSCYAPDPLAPFNYVCIGSTGRP
jgi:hypothetical protein